jgi:hypothetical protein
MATKKIKTAKPVKSGRKTQAGAAKLSASGPLPPYGVPIREAIASGDVKKMRKVAASTRKWIKDVQASLDAMEKSMGKLGG